MAAEAGFIEVQKAQGPQLNPTPAGTQFASAYQQIWALAQTYMDLYRKISWVKSCVDIIADTATSERYVIRTVDQQQELDDQAENPRIQSLQTVLNAINPNYDALELANMNFRAMEINGTSYNRILRKAGGGHIVGLEYIAFTRVKPVVDDQGNITSYLVKHKRGSGTETILAKDMAVFKLPHPTDDVIGLSPLESLDLPTAVDLQAQRFNESAFRNGPYASMIMVMKNMDEDDMKRNKDYIRDNFTKPENAHKPMLLQASGEGEIEVVGDALQRRGVDGSFIELRKFNREEICSVYRVPTTKIITDGANRSNTEEHDETFIRDTIEPIQRLYWGQFNRRILQGELGVYDLYLESGKKQDVSMAAVNIANKMVQSGASINEGRKVMNLNSKDGYDTPMVNKLIVEDDQSEPGAKQQKPTAIIPAPQDEPKQVQKSAQSLPDGADTSQQEQEFIAAYLSLMAQIRRRERQAVSLHDLHKAWQPNVDDVRSLAESIAELYRETWLQSYNLRRMQMGGEPLKDLPPDVAAKLAEQATQTAQGIFETYGSQLTDWMQEIMTQNNGLNAQVQFDNVLGDVNDWLRQRATQKAKEISVTESGKVWQDALFSHDRKYAPNTKYTVLPTESSPDECVAIIAGAPYTLDTIPADLPLHPNCPHRYYAIAE